MTTTTKQRLLSLDTLRGFDMFWIVGGELIFLTLSKQTDWAWANVMATQMEHASWGNFHFYDLIFPLFMFISGVTIPYALFGKMEKGTPKKELYLKVIKRAVILVVLGLVYNRLLDFEFEKLRVASVLGEIGIAYLIASIIAINARSFKTISFWIVGILAGHAILQLFVPVPGHGAGVLTPEGCIDGYIDRMFLPGRLYNKAYDPEGILCVMFASVLPLMGTLAGLILRSKDSKPYKKIIMLVIIGALLVIAALVLDIWYPIIKDIATSPFHLLTGGLSFLLLALFYMVIDVWKFQKWTLFFQVIGMNSITIYMAYRLIAFEATSGFLFGGLARISGGFEPVVLVVGLLSIEWLFLYFLYKRKIFLKV
jgi:predicted acyltransferase